MNKKKCIAVALSGGVDSATSAMLLLDQGYDVMGITMKLFKHHDAEIESAKKIASQLGIQHHVVDYQDEFKDVVVKYFKETYEQGRTPNPCLKCNKVFKYGKLIEFAKSKGADFFATGHYARKICDESTGRYKLLSGLNQRKDQSYNLFQLTQEHLEFLMFPVGCFEDKDKVREISKDRLQFLSKKNDSTGICFIEGNDWIGYLKSLESSAVEEGDFIDTDGNFIGNHKGIAAYTIGQKRRLGMNITGRYLVTAIDAPNNKIILGSEDDLIKSKIRLYDTNFINDVSLPFKADIRVSQWSTVYSGTVMKEDESIVIEFSDSVRAPAPGQAAVFYIKDQVIGGGFIE